MIIFVKCAIILEYAEEKPILDKERYDMMNISALILAGSGKETNQKRPEAMWEVLGEPLIGWVIDSLKGMGIDDDRIGIIAEKAPACLTDYLSGRGGLRVFGRTGDAGELLSGNVLMIGANTPFINCDTLAAALNEHTFTGNAATAIGFAAYWFRADALKKPLTGNMADIVADIAANGGKIGELEITDPNILLGAETRGDLLRLNITAKMAVIGKLLDEGVEFVSTDGVIIEKTVKIGKDTTILPGTILRGNTVIGEDCVLGPNTLIENCTIGNGVILNSVQAYEAKVADRVKAGPFVQLRPGTVLHEGVKIGDFVEIKNSEIGTNTAVAHLTYLGDSDVGKGVNFGCGCVTANYDGVDKFRTKIGDHAFIGCNTNLVAPVEIGENATTAAGSTITKHDTVPANSLVIQRAETVVKEDWEHNFKRKKKA